MPRFLIAAALIASPVLAHDPVDWNGATYQVLLDAEESGGDLGMFVVAIHGPNGPPMHVHDDASETFYLLEGRARFVVEGESVEIGPGEVAFVPAGAAHTFRMLDEAGGRQLTILAPGGFETFFEAMAAEDLKIPQDMPRINEIAAEYHLRFTGPPLPAE